MAGQLKLNGVTLATEENGSATLENTSINLLSSGASIRKSDGTTAVLSESGGTVALENITNLEADSIVDKAGTGAPDFPQGATFSGSVSGIGQLVGIMHQNAGGGFTNYVTLQNNKTYDVVYHARYGAGVWEITEYATCSVNGSGVVTITEVVEISNTIIELQSTTNAIRFFQDNSSGKAIGFVFERGTTFDNV